MLFGTEHGAPVSYVVAAYEFSGTMMSADTKLAWSQSVDAIDTSFIDRVAPSPAPSPSPGPVPDPSIGTKGLNPSGVEIQPAPNPTK